MVLMDIPNGIHILMMMTADQAGTPKVNSKCLKIVPVVFITEQMPSMMPNQPHQSTNGAAAACNCSANDKKYCKKCYNMCSDTVVRHDTLLFDVRHLLAMYSSLFLSLQLLLFLLLFSLQSLLLHQLLNPSAQ